MFSLIRISTLVALLAAVLAALLPGCSQILDSPQPPPAEERDATDASSPIGPGETGSSKVDASKVAASRAARAENVTPGLPAATADLIRQRDTGAAAAPASELTGGIRSASEPLDRENYGHFDDHPVHLVSADPVSTFSIDVDTASYSNLRRILNQGQLPRHDAVRVEELLNYFSYAYPGPKLDAPFTVHTELGPSPWHPSRYLLHIGIQGYAVAPEALPASNLVFLIDVSGSMQNPAKLALLKTALKLLVQQLDGNDRISMVVYAGAAGQVLAPTPGNQRATITAAIEALEAGGSTNGGAGIRLAYAMAEQARIPGGVNRVILATDGDFNVGTTNQQALKDLVAANRRSGIALTVLGFGSGNYNDALMQELAQIGDGNAAYIDTLNEARKVLVDELSATLLTIARDVKIQVEFNPAQVQEYRLIGYETRQLDRADFNNDNVDAGDIGAGHTVTAIYELALVGSTGALVDPLRYQNAVEGRPVADAGVELAFVKLRFKAPGSEASQLLSHAVTRGQIVPDLQQTSDDFRFAAAVAGFGQVLRGGAHTGRFTLGDVIALASGARGNDPFGYRGEFVNLARTAAALTPAPTTEPRRAAGWEIGLVDQPDIAH